MHFSYVLFALLFMTHTHTNIDQSFQTEEHVAHTKQTATSRSASSTQREPTESEQHHWITAPSLHAACWNESIRTTQTVWYGSAGANLWAKLNLILNIHCIGIFIPTIIKYMGTVWTPRNNISKTSFLLSYECGLCSLDRTSNKAQWTFRLTEHLKIILTFQCFAQ